jgi:hypothetical protein
MSKEYRGIIRKTKPASGPGKAIAKRKRATKHKPYARNSLYTAAAAFKQRHPQATALDAWRHFTGLAGISAVSIAYDAAADVLTYAPDPERFGTREIKRRSFEQGYYKLPG